MPSKSNAIRAKALLPPITNRHITLTNLKHMKKFLAALLVGTATLTASAQTDFRHITFDEALTAAKQENKLVFIDFFTTWCGPCKMMSNKVFPQVEVGNYMNAKFIPLKLDAEKEGLDLSKKYGVTAYPTYVIVNSAGELQAKFSGAMDGEKFVAKLETSLDPDMQPARIKERYVAGERNPKLVNAYAMQFMEARDEANGFKVIDEYFASLNDADRLKDENSFIFTTYTVDLENDRARFMVANRDKFGANTTPAVKKRIADLYHNELNTYFSGYKRKEGLFNADTYAQLKKDFADLGLNDDNKYNSMFNFIEQRNALNDADFMAFCESNYDTLSDRNKEVLIMNLPRLFNLEEAASAKGVSKFIRTRLNTMSPIAIQLAGRTLGNIEK